MFFFKTVLLKSKSIVQTFAEKILNVIMTSNFLNNGLVIFDGYSLGL